MSVDGAAMRDHMTANTPCEVGSRAAPGESQSRAREEVI